MIDFSFKNFSLRQALRLTPFRFRTRAYGTGKARKHRLKIKHPPSIHCCFAISIGVIYGGSAFTSDLQQPSYTGWTADIRGTRVTFQTLLDHLEDGDGSNGLAEFLRGFPTVSRDQALAALAENSKLHLLK